MLLSIEEAFNEQDNKDVSLMVKILAVNAAKKSESGKNYTEVTIADSTGLANMKVFKQDEMQKLAELPSVILMNVIKKSNCFIFTVKSRASITAEINYKTTTVQTPEKKMTIKDMLTSKEKGNVHCRIIKVFIQTASITSESYCCTVIYAAIYLFYDCLTFFFCFVFFHCSKN